MSSNSQIVNIRYILITNLKYIIAFLILNGLVSFAKAQNPIVQEILNTVKIDSMTFFVQQLSGEEHVIIGGVPDTILSRHKDQPGNEKAFQFVKEKFAGYGLEVDSLQFSTTGKNLMGIKTGTAFPDRKYIIGAHYDNKGGAVAPGADDNGSGSAAVIEAARVFVNYSFPFTIVFALWDEEEQGLVGSKAYASMAASINDTILGYINMDMLGWDENNDSVADLHVRAVANSLQLASKAIEADSVYHIGLGLHIVNPGTGSTDHAAFWYSGFTAIGINEEYDGDFNPFWHSPADSLGQFNIPFYEKCAKLAYATLGECALDSMITVSIGESLIADFVIELYPNPASDIITVVVRKIDLKNISFIISSLDGQIVKTVSTNSFPETEIDIGSLPAGIYLLSIVQNRSRIGVMKWIKLG
jgi:Peptidase family M28/Secretion system C-terminal sorting domain